MTFTALVKFPAQLMALPAIAAMGLAQGAFAQDKAPAETFSFNGYWRAQYHTAANPLHEAPATQGTSSAPTSRHVYAANFWNISLSKSMDTGAKYVFKVDGDWPAKVNHEAGEHSLLNVRDLYASLPVAEGINVWAGAREVLFEDVRIFDIGNPFNVNAFGVGAGIDKASVLMSFTKTNIPRADANGLPIIRTPATVPSATPTPFTTPGKDLTLLARYELGISDTLSVKPMALLVLHGGAPEQKVTRAKEVKGSTEFKLGAVISHGTGENSGNATLWLQSEPVDKTGAVSGSNTLIGLNHSSTWDLGAAGILTGFSMQAWSLKNKAQVYKVDNGAIVIDGTNTTTSTMRVSVGVQPVYYVTDKLHAALDLNYAMITKKLRDTDANMTAVTPIVRWAMSKNPVGSPQIYTSMTYGMYDAKVKMQTNGEAKNSLITTQTGMEVWF